jgi:hypothetical protein
VGKEDADECRVVNFINIWDLIYVYCLCFDSFNVFVDNFFFVTFSLVAALSIVVFFHLFDDDINIFSLVPFCFDYN